MQDTDVSLDPTMLAPLEELNMPGMPLLDRFSEIEYDIAQSSVVPTCWALNACFVMDIS